MNVAATIELDLEKFFKGTETSAEKFYNAFKQWFGNAPSVLQTIENFVSEAAPIITAAVAIAVPGGPALAAVSAALSTAQVGLAGLYASVSAAQSGTSVLSNLQNFTATVPKLLTSLDIKNSNLQALITRIVNLITNEAKVLLPVVENWIAQLQTKPTASVPLPAGAQA